MTFSRLPRIQKGAFVQFDEQNPQGRKIVFQYNPDKINRRFKAQTENSDRWSLRSFLRKNQSPIETISFILTLDATDNLEQPNDHPDTVESGIYPLLSAIEMLVYRQSSEQTRRSFMGITWPITTKKQPLTLFIWGNKRVLPVLVTDLRIIEEMFDPALNPVRANIKITMHVLNDADLPRCYKGYEYKGSHIKSKIAIAKTVYTDAQINKLKDITR